MSLVFLPLISKGLSNLFYLLALQTLDTKPLYTEEELQRFEAELRDKEEELKRKAETLRQEQELLKERGKALEAQRREYQQVRSWPGTQADTLPDTTFRLFISQALRCL